MITLDDGTPTTTNPLDAFANARAEAEKAKAALLARLEEIKAEAKSIKAALGRTRNPKAAKPGQKPKNAPIEK